MDMSGGMITFLGQENVVFTTYLTHSMMLPYMATVANVKGWSNTGRRAHR